MPGREQGREPRDRLVDRHPAEPGAEPFHGIPLAWADTGQQLEADDLARSQRLAARDRPFHDRDRVGPIPEVVDRHARVDRLHSTPSRRRFTLTSPPRMARTYSSP